MKTQIFSILILLTMILLSSGHLSADEKPRKLIYSADFKDLDSEHWVVELDSVGASSVYIKKGNLVLDTKAGVTVWLNKELQGDIEIEYTRKIILDGGPNDRLSDMNQFWMASDPGSANLFTRKGKLSEYDNLSLYYAGIGGNYNSTTRFRKYHNGERVLLKEYTAKEKMLQSNHEYRVKTVIKNGKTSVWVDGELYFEYMDPQPLLKGYFGFRSTWSRQEIKDFKVYAL